MKQQNQFTKEKQDQNLDSFESSDGLSGVIALFIFSNFQHEANLTGSILANISIAFAFGVGVDKSLEAINKFRSGKF
jgi:hypothetical protein